MIEQSTIDSIQSLLPHLSERQRRLYLASEARRIGYGGQKEICKAFHVSPMTLRKGLKELDSGEVLEDEHGDRRDRRTGGGRKSIEESQPGIAEAIEKLVEPSTFGDPENPLRWTTRSQRNIAEALRAEGFSIDPSTVGKVLRHLGYSLHVNQKNKQVGPASPDRDEQFRLIDQRAQAFLATDDPVISVDCKNKINIGNFLNKGSEYTPAKQPTQVLDHDFPLKELGKAVPYGVYDIGRNEGFVSVGISKDTAQFAVHSILQWWKQMGKEVYTEADRLLITADGGGSNNCRCRLWKAELQKLANATGLEIEVHHFPPGCSKWNKIEHRLFSQISKNWRGRPLESLEAIVSLIGSTTTETGLSVTCDTDKSKYESGIKITDEQMDELILWVFEFHPEWNYIIRPNGKDGIEA